MVPPQPLQAKPYFSRAFRNSPASRRGRGEEVFHKKARNE
jgi:hypothetical protein